MLAVLKVRSVYWALNDYLPAEAKNLGDKITNAILPEEFNQDLDWGVLEPGEIERLERILQNVFRYLAELRLKDALANRIQNPKIPRVMSESAVINIRSKLFPGSLGARFGGAVGDILLQFPDGERRAEVKATGKQGYEKLGKKDISADYLIWIHFGSSFEDGKGGVVLYKLAKPSLVLTTPPNKQFLDIRINEFLKIAARQGLEEFRGSSLGEIVRTYAAA